EDARIKAQESVDAAGRTAGTTSEMTKQLTTLYNQLKQTSITADQSGVVTKLNVQKGAIASGTLMQIEDDSKLRVKVNIRERDIIKLKSGMKVNLTADAFPDQVFTGVVDQVINFTSSSVDYSAATDSMGMGGGSTASSSSYSAYINVDDGSPLLLGMTVKAEILLDVSEPQLAVGFDAIAYDDNGEAYVIRVSDNGGGQYRCEKVVVTVGDAGDYYTAITSDALTEGDLILSYPYGVNDGDIIDVEVVGTADGAQTGDMPSDDAAENE
ncbi:MAG: efflux RND transporter periplasmic adaptor subunit, partial [Lachnospiraceae bacterium]|nr:efflux RND transporter periplasmic adaptor subunit [Lachnospiraceae bacterium]